MGETIIERLRALFVESLHVEPPPPETDLFESGTLDSLQLVELLVQLERRFGVQIAIESLDLENLRTLARIADLVAAGCAQASSGVKQGNAEKKVANG